MPSQPDAPQTHGPTLFMIDFEGSKKSGVVESGVVELLGGREIISAQTACYRPIGPMDNSEIRTHGLKAGSLSEKSYFHHHFDTFKVYRQKGFFGAHYACVEDAFLTATWPYPGDVPCALEPGYKTNQWGPWIDTCMIYKRLYPSLPSHQLSDLIDVFALTPALQVCAQQWVPLNRQRFHAALFDALACALLLIRLFSLPGLEGLTYPWLLQASLSSVDIERTRQRDFF